MGTPESEAIREVSGRPPATSTLRTSSAAVRGLAVLLVHRLPLEEAVVVLVEARLTGGQVDGHVVVPRALSRVGRSGDRLVAGRLDRRRRQTDDVQPRVVRRRRVELLLGQLRGAR